MNTNKLIPVFCGLTLSFVSTMTFAELLKEKLSNTSRMEYYGGLLYLQPSSSNMKYAVFVSGQQPYSQSWHYQEVHPKYSPAFEIGLNYNMLEQPYQATLNWLHLDTSDSTFKQANPAVSLSNVEFIAPAYDVGPAVFGIKRAEGRVKFAFDSIDIIASRLFEYGSNVQMKLFGGLNILRINQTVTAVFNDYAGALPTAYSYVLPPDPSFYFETQNESKYTGAGPELGLNIQYFASKGFGVIGELSGSLTAGTQRVVNNFTSNSSRLINLGLSPSHQDITTPNITQVVTGFDGKLGLFYRYSNQKIQAFTIEGGYRLAFYNNAIADVNPSSLVQAGTVAITPEFSTGTMAINATKDQSRNFSFNGPYLQLKLALV